MRITAFLSLLLVLISTGCQKNKVEELHKEMIGEWYHYTGNETYYSITINSNGRGYIYEKTENNDGLDTQGRAWLIKDDKLIFSRFNREEFNIDLYPITTDTLVIALYDTIAPGRTYMILDGDHFRKK